jgi:hypothetical protein
MSWSAWITVNHGDGYTSTFEVVDGHTYNLTPMWRRAGVVHESTRELDRARTEDLFPRLDRALQDAHDHPDEYRALNPPSGWGDYEGFVEILTRFRDLCAEHPRGVVGWSA